ncbi:bifunctional [glutamate--ammonia ligase]-adenylyl-L-tyrosine phosphorylase/[glutamate--ammonia-ligase] adenylyltransferase [Succinimonas amylolytica]|uniref:bifunctional [glutamate--ammonia ligase]-adenylyl-L-tyrosine phosphorylase/[glutamate--ammonia-ligase] adenylyltransferase n=1 Tax=Succinimonas amylolytica TaxID=83769 RepID=UPI000381FAEB|nr:bifunctional [glutamate--ammonia ligase]-adenylyl-L-tyrosine phosphorylase/[glutamate--ammonia-ligase] adenylyltransferase [Succinimonas amylolytica]
MAITDEMAAQAEKNLTRLFDGVKDPDLEVLEKHRVLIREVFAYSDYVSWYAIKWRSRFVRMLESGEYEWSHRYESYRSEIRVLIRDVSNLESLKKAVREFRNDKMAVIAIREILGKSTLNESLMHSSLLAEAVVVEVLDYLYRLNAGISGIPVSASSGAPQKMLVIGMGKLGGYELNFSSDIDLIFCYPERGETIGGRKPVDNQVFFTRLGQQLIQVLEQKTGDGFAYRVDMRLRPFGDSGPLVSSFAALEDYYLRHGRSWERYAMVKGRVLGDETPEGEELMDMLRPFVYRRYLDFGAIEALRKMKSLIEAEVRRRHLFGNFKLGEGGIREVEFVAQVFQLMRGGRIKDLQERTLLRVLVSLRDCGCIDEASCRVLSQGYVFLRRTENLLQEIRDEQTQTIPQNSLDRSRLHLAMGFDTFEAFYDRLTEVMHEVHREFSAIISEPAEEKDEEDPVFMDLWLVSLTPDEIEELLEKNFRDVSDIPGLATEIVHLKKELHSRSIGPNGREILNRLMPYFLGRLALFDEDVLPTFKRISRLIWCICQRTTYMQLLLENNGVAEQVLKLCHESELISEQITEHPILLDELLIPENLYRPVNPLDYDKELREFMLRIENDDLEQQMEALRQFKLIQLLRICAADLAGVLPLMKVSDYLTFLAQSILNEVVNLAWKQVTDKYGEPGNARVRGDRGFAVIAYGKMGGIELGYGSDLDLVFMSDSSLDGETYGKQVVSDRMFYGRLAQRIMHLFSTRLSSGILYDVDARLRPEGESGPLVCTLNGYENYLEKRAWTWEIQALVRARAVVGPERMIGEFNRIRDRFLRKPRDPEVLRKEVADMRVKMSQNLNRARPGFFDLKHSPGGMIDVEFTAQYLVLANAPGNPDMVLWSDNIRIFEECVRLNLLSPEDGNYLKEAYLAIRNRYNRQALLGKSKVVPDTELIPEREHVAAIWKRIVGGVSHHQGTSVKKNSP